HHRHELDQMAIGINDWMPQTATDPQDLVAGHEVERHVASLTLVGRVERHTSNAAARTWPRGSVMITDQTGGFLDGAMASGLSDLPCFRSGTSVSAGFKLSVATPVVTMRPGSCSEWEQDGSIEELARIAETADRLGYYHLTCSEHIAVPETE